MSKRFGIPADQIKPIATNHGACLATDMITVEGAKVGYMYRQEPTHETDSGWVFLAGTESPEYMDDPENTSIYDVNTIANYDVDIVPLLHAPVGSAFARNELSGKLERENSELPVESSALTGYSNVPEMPTTPDFCDQCGLPLEIGEFEIRSKTETQVAGIVAYHRSMHLALCRNCANTRDSTSNHMLWGAAAFVAIVVLIGLASSICSGVIGR